MGAADKIVCAVASQQVVWMRLRLEEGRVIISHDADCFSNGVSINAANWPQLRDAINTAMEVSSVDTST